MVKKEEPGFCGFCKRNGEVAEFYQSHKLRDSDQRIVCPILSKFKCPYCAETGVHTAGYCPQNPKVQQNQHQANNSTAARRRRRSDQSNSSNNTSPETSFSSSNSTSHNSNKHLQSTISQSQSIMDTFTKPKWPPSGALPGARLSKKRLMQVKLMFPENRIQFILEEGFNPRRLELIEETANWAQRCMISCSNLMLL